MTRKLILGFCHVGLTCIHVGSLENYASRLIMSAIYTCWLEKPFDQDVKCILYFIVIVSKLQYYVELYAISFDLCTALMDHLYFKIIASALVSPIYNYTLFVCEF